MSQLTGGFVAAEATKRHRVNTLLAWAQVPFVVVVAVIAASQGVNTGASGLFMLASALLLVLEWRLMSGATPEVRAIPVAASLMLSSFGLVAATGGAEVAHLSVFVAFSALTLYHLWTPLVVGGVLAVGYHFLTVPWKEAVAHSAFILAFCIVAYLRWRMNEALLLKYDMVSTAFANTSSIAQRGNERADAAERAQEEFLGMMVHKLKTPITVMRGYADMLTTFWDQIDDDKKLGFIARIRESAVAMNETIEEDLLVIRNEHEGWHAECVATTNLDVEVEEVIADLAVEYEPLEFWGADLSGIEVVVDHRVLRIILEHLVENARTHGFDKRPIITQTSNYRRCVQVSVSGWGTADVPRLNEDCFNRGVSRGGSGLGLWIVRNYARSMSGDISVEQVDREDERRTTFTLTLPKRCVLEMERKEEAEGESVIYVS